jgi:predicted anti-sigma-YlaC factor YlaD
MSCEKLEQVQAYFDSEMTPRDHEAFAAHLEACADCRALLAELQALSNLFAAAPLPAMPAGLFNRLEKTWTTTRDRGVLRIASWLTAAAASVLIGTLLIHRAAPEPSAPWQTAAVMPPMESHDEPAAEYALAAQWIANDLSVGDRQ